MSIRRSKRPHSLKFHAIALGAICFIIVILYWLIVPDEAASPTDPNIPTGDVYVRIVDATWGQNCNTEINRLRSMGKLTEGEGPDAKPLTPVQPNNAMYAITAICDDKIKCDILATNDVMQINPLSSCYKELVVGYRCFSIDRKWTRKVEQGTTLTIDCNPDVDQSKAGQ